MPVEISPSESFEVPETGNTGNVDTPIGRIIVNLPTPIFQAAGGQVYKLLLETIASQVKMSDGVSVETRLTTMERALAANTTTRFADTIEERDKLSGLIPGDRVFVTDASGDDTVEKGAATYIYMPDLSFRKINEDESMDVVFKWENIEDGPESAPADIDSAVIQQHRHANKTELDALADDGAGNLLFHDKRVYDGLRDVVVTDCAGTIPDNLRDGGLMIVNPALSGLNP